MSVIDKAREFVLYSQTEGLSTNYAEEADDHITALIKEIMKRDAVIEAAKKCIKTYNAGNRAAWDEALDEVNKLK